MEGYYAFWNYDTCPYLLGGEITQMRDNGRVETKQYGKGHFFMPVKILPAEQGKKLLAELDRLRADYYVAQKAFHKTWHAQGRALRRRYHVPID